MGSITGMLKLYSYHCSRERLKKSETHLQFPAPLFPTTPSDLLTKLRFHWRKEANEGEATQEEVGGERLHCSAWTRRPSVMGRSAPRGVQSLGSLFCCVTVLIIPVWSLALPSVTPRAVSIPARLVCQQWQAPFPTEALLSPNTQLHGFSWDLWAWQASPEPRLDQMEARAFSHWVGWSGETQLPLCSQWGLGHQEEHLFLCSLFKEHC